MISFPLLPRNDFAIFADVIENAEVQIGKFNEIMRLFIKESEVVSGRVACCKGSAEEGSLPALRVIPHSLFLDMQKMIPLELEGMLSKLQQVARLFRQIYQRERSDSYQLRAAESIFKFFDARHFQVLNYHVNIYKNSFGWGLTDSFCKGTPSHLSVPCSPTEGEVGSSIVSTSYSSKDDTYEGLVKERIPDVLSGKIDYTWSLLKQCKMKGSRNCHFNVSTPPLVFLFGTLAFLNWEELKAVARVNRVWQKAAVTRPMQASLKLTCHRIIDTVEGPFYHPFPKSRKCYELLAKIRAWSYETTYLQALRVEREMYDFISSESVKLFTKPHISRKRKCLKNRIYILSNLNLPLEQAFYLYLKKLFLPPHLHKKNFTCLSVANFRKIGDYLEWDDLASWCQVDNFCLRMIPRIGMQARLVSGFEVIKNTIKRPGYLAGESCLNLLSQIQLEVDRLSCRIHYIDIMNLQRVMCELLMNKECATPSKGTIEDEDFFSTNFYLERGDYLADLDLPFKRAFRAILGRMIENHYTATMRPYLSISVNGTYTSTHFIFALDKIVRKLALEGIECQWKIPESRLSEKQRVILIELERVVSAIHV